MSTRSIVAVETEVGIVGVYVHSDGYPEGQWGRLGTYRALIERDGVQKVCETLLRHAHWSYIFAEDPNSEEAQRRARWEHTVEPGYGGVLSDPRLESPDKYFRPSKLDEWWDIEFVYVIHPETGRIRWAAPGVRRPTAKNAWEALTWREESDVPVAQ